MAVFIIFGFIASIFQLVILREFSFSIAKNELAFIIAAGFWVISCSLGSIVKIADRYKSQLQFFFASLVFFASVTLIHTAKLLAGLRYYETASLTFILISSIILIGPPAFAIGNIFRKLVQEYLSRNPAKNNIYAKFFAFEAIGFFIGGTAFTFCLSRYTNPLVFSCLPALLTLRGKNKLKKILALALIILTALSSFKLFGRILKKEMQDAQILLKAGSRYGPVLSVYKAGVTSTYSQGSILASSEDKAATEEFIHIGLAALRSGQGDDILFIGPGLSKEPEEILKYSPASLDLLQINPLILELAKKSLPAGIKNRVNFITDDPRAYLKKTTKLYDAILMDMPPPATLSLNRYFTEEFFRLVSLRLKPEGIFSFHIPSKREILSPGFSRFNSAIINAVDAVFKERIIIPSDSMIITASCANEIRDYQLIDNFSRANPRTDFFTIYHFKDLLDPSIRAYIQSRLDSKAKANKDLNLAGFLNYLILEQAKFYPGLRIDFVKMRRPVLISLLLLATFIAALAFLSKRLSCLLNSGAVGFTSISLSSIIFVLFQIYCGGLFWKLGLLIALFMGGLSLGALIMNKISDLVNNLLPVLYLCWIAVILTLSLSLRIIPDLNYADIIFYFYSLICGSLTGASYPLLADSFKKNNFERENITTAIYSSDLAGAFLGTLLCGVVLIPFLGITASLAALLIINLIFALKTLRG